MAVNVSENARAELVCMGSGPPTPTFLVKKTEPVPGKVALFHKIIWWLTRPLIILYHLEKNNKHAKGVVSALCFVFKYTIVFNPESARTDFARL